MAEKKKRPSTARPRAGKAAAAPAAPVSEVTAAVVAMEAAPVAAAAVEAPVAAIEAAPIEAAPVAEIEAAPVPLAGLEVDAQPVTHERIARRAYELYRARGGSAFDNWLQAERELRG